MAEYPSVMRELIVKLDEVKIALIENKTQREGNEEPTKGGARPKTRNSWAPKDLQEDLKGVGITLTIMESIKEALIELSDTTKENNKEEKEEVGKEAVKK